MNFSTLERRLQSLMKRFQNNRNQNLSHHNPHVGIMIPTPGLQPSGNVTAMIPTPGTDVSMVNCPGTSTVVLNTAGTGNMLPNSNENTSLLQGNSILATDNNSSKMVPTPGLNNAFPISGDNMSSLPGQQQVQPHKSHVIDHSPQRNFQLPRGNLIQQYSQQLQQSHQQNMQHQPQQQQQYQQQHHNHQENQQFTAIWNSANQKNCGPSTVIKSSILFLPLTLFPLLMCIIEIKQFIPKYFGESRVQLIVMAGSLIVLSVLIC